MNQELILLPVIAMVLLTVIVAVCVLFTRIRTIVRRRIRPQNIATRTGSATLLKDVAAPSDNLMNLFEMPVLFYLLTVLLYTTGLADREYLVLASLYVVLRYAHSVIHVTYNRVMHRFAAFLVSCIVLWAMWGRFAWQLFMRWGLDACL